VTVQRAIIPTVHLALAGVVAMVAIIGLFGTEAAASAGEEAAQGPMLILGGAGISILIVLPLAGVVSLGLYDWQVGRGALVLRAADAAVFALAALDLSSGVTGPIRWLVGTMALLAASGVAASFVLPRPRRAGFRL